MLSRILSTDVVGFIAMILSAIMVYGAKIIVLKVFQFPPEKALKPMLIWKFTGLFIGILGMLRIMGII